MVGDVTGWHPHVVGASEAVLLVRVRSLEGQSGEWDRGAVGVRGLLSVCFAAQWVQRREATEIFGGVLLSSFA